MRAVRGFERPILQWIFVALGAALVVAAAGEAVALRRAQSTIERLRAADLNARVDREQIEARLTREQSARESFALEVARMRGRATTTSPSEPTLTLSPIRVRRATPPDPTVRAPAPAQPIQLRLLLPKGRADAATRYAVALRSWSGGRVVWLRSDLSATTVDGQPAVTTRLTGDALTPGAYEIALTDVTADRQPADVAFYEITIGAGES
jgi:hypothetical protein